jgi:hypothetical protein
MLIEREFAAECVITVDDGLRCYSGKRGVEVVCKDGPRDAAVVLDRTDAINLARWLLEVCEASS